MTHFLTALQRTGEAEFFLSNFPAPPYFQPVITASAGLIPFDVHRFGFTATTNHTQHTVWFGALAASPDLPQMRTAMQQIINRFNRAVPQHVTVTSWVGLATLANSKHYDDHADITLYSRNPLCPEFDTDAEYCTYQYQQQCKEAVT